MSEGKPARESGASEMEFGQRGVGLARGASGRSADRRSRVSRRTFSSPSISDPTGYAAKTEELAYLANALVAGCSTQARPFTAREASDAVLAICNLGLEYWPRHWLPADARDPEDLIVGRDLISVFQMGWTVLHRDLCLYATAQLIRVLDELRCGDQHIQSALSASASTFISKSGQIATVREFMRSLRSALGG